MIKQVPCSVLLDAQELIAEYAAECSIPAIGEINPQAYIYDALQSSGVLRSFIALDNDKVVGFANVLTPILPHYGKRVASIESLFIATAYRKNGIGQELMREVERYANSAGCVGILYSSPAGGELEKLLDGKIAYQRTNTVFYMGFA
jgi:GNAT superfamily N-acetyltransferase